MPGGAVLNVVWFLAGTTVTGVATAWKVAPVMRRLSHLVDDLIGEPARTGVAARPGVMERLAQLEAGQVHGARVQQEQAADIEAQSGSLLSLAAAVDQIRAWMESQGKPPLPPQQRTA